MLLTLLFFYDIFFVFGTDVMLTVAKNIDAPIKLQFPRDYSGEKPQFSILGLGDIVIPGIFVSLCLRYDFLRSIDPKKFEKLVEADDAGDLIKYLNNTSHNAPKSYFIAVNIGYLIAIICTVIVMLVFNHG
jgi:minor histocompatibility antigen H13